MLAKYVLFLGVGKLLIYIGQNFIHSNTKSEFINKLFSCDLCLGVWVYTILSWALGVAVLSDILPYVPFLSELIAGCLSSFVAHLLTVGWKTKYEVVVIE